ncbi:glucose-methanol-choline oxidoreductase-like protein [Setomelanomma holmii]|uniref:Glucose-methanol-choline oxidoreductase-like protein n=1 Tax=Setomelanomma holmii TaxID=210430 RepID=A0A9P4GV40_9PLEO|nr:glucose-methanol-choline oxidoreductase-like protein [Setomelanomma holmii]
MDSTNKSAEYDFVVVGGGTAGNAVAGRLAENPSVTVAIVEAGAGDTKDIDMVTTPARAFEIRGSKYDWNFKATFVDRPDYTRVEKPHTRGKLLGGSSIGNYYTWVRGSKGTIDDWEEFGGPEWNWNQCEEYFNKPATYHDDRAELNPVLAKMNRNGPLNISVSDMVPELQPFRDALTSAWVSKGGVLRENIYEGTQEGLVKNLNSIYKGVRTTSVEYLTGKSNITIVAKTEVVKVIIADGIATGIEVLDAEGNTSTINARREVIVAAGAFQTPHLLMLSGIGPKDHLDAYAIPCLVDSKHVGQNLLDHPIMPHVFKFKTPVGLDHHLLQNTLEKQAAQAAYQRDRSGPLNSGLLELIAFPRIDQRLEKYPEYRKAKEANGGMDPFGPDGQPHFEIDFVPMFSDAFQFHFPAPADGSDCLTVIVDLLRPLSKPGEIRLQSADHKVQPYINENFLENDLDILGLREGVRYIDDILMNGEGMKDILGEDYPWPMPRTSDEAMNRQILERCQTGYHPCGTARLGKDIGQGVVDAHLKVYGVSRLRVIDASVFPVIPDCRIQNDVYMVAEKGADMIKAEHEDLYKVEWSAKVVG